MIVYKSKEKRGRGLVNKLINKLPIELHLPGYQYCGPGTKLAKRLARGDPGINQLDSACKEHDIAYSQNRENLEARHAADRTLATKAWQRVRSRDAGIGERAAAWAVTNAMNLKTKLGQGLKKRKEKINEKQMVKASTPFNTIVRAAKAGTSGKCFKKAISSAIKKAREAIKKAGGKSYIKIPRVLPVPKKIGGFTLFDSYICRIKCNRSNFRRSSRCS